MKDSENILTEVASRLQEHIDDGNSNVNIYTTPARMPILNAFAIMFCNSFLLSIDEYNLNRNDIRVILKICTLMQFGNLVRISWSDVGEELGIDRRNMSKHIKNIKNARLLIEDKGGNVFLNPQIIAKGKFLKNSTSQEDRDLIEVLNLGAAAIEGTVVSPSIITPQIRDKLKKEKKKEQVKGKRGSLQQIDMLKLCDRDIEREKKEKERTKEKENNKI